MKAILFALLSLPLPLSSATTVPVGPGKTTPAPGTAPWHTFDRSDGLASEIIRDIVQDQQGHLWVATWEPPMTDWEPT